MKSLAAIVAIAAALMSASASAQVPKEGTLLLPPVEFDYPYEGKLTIVRDKEDLPDIHLYPHDKDRALLGCAMRYRNADGTLEKGKEWQKRP
jgi:hypothetical protein